MKAKFFEYLEDHLILMYEKNKDDPKLLKDLKNVFLLHEMEKLQNFTKN